MLPRLGLGCASMSASASRNAINRSEVDAKKKQLRDIEEEEKRAAQSAKSSFLPPVLLGNMKRYFWSRKAKIRASAAKAFGDPSLDPDHVSNKKKKRLQFQLMTELTL